MTNMTTTLPHGLQLREAILALIQRHGRWRVMRSALFARPLPRADRPGVLSDHLRRDIGLPEHGPVAPSLRHLVP